MKKQRYVTKNESDKRLTKIIDDLKSDIWSMRNCQNCKHSIGSLKVNCSKRKSCIVYPKESTLFEDFFPKKDLWVKNE